jgi:hypothetical protein
MKNSASRRELDSLVVGVELTLISIIQGVALTFLIESARNVISPDEMIITVIRWPLEFGHNFFYIACAFVEALLFTRLHHPAGWFALGATFGVIGWLLFVYDLRLIRACAEEKIGPMNDQLVALVRRDQYLNIFLLLPGVFLYNLFCFWLIRSQPGLFVEKGSHFWLGCGEFAGFAAYLCYVLAYFKKIIPVLSAAREEREAQG